ncbi:Adenine deaminase [Paraburkholderia domus]|jgi:adenosine deaminase|uniref:adenosine deaminase n=1 Tax=Paraburkholderia domus TaxID=2793075 RepID=UPI001914738E|nr:adenosine deaminase [Paraburkholderia domus]MBK5053605.1 adenosine deaminase [Burkholderia sp. R-70006]MBK5064888.1 adenosine deaminase [Burkholderia sp. R-70199]MBK5090875.1 adenosine deaminase [Burkholderia sp. R-69927]MBK5183825.1 adenosine deaminase [Burkholderia sp. R-69749]MCI0144342.1 adenosine deaminase [Paraburkholderia sediminicola]
MNDDRLVDFIRGVPKAELHVHLEGSITPERVIALAERNRISLPFDGAEAVNAAMTYGNLDEFLNMFSLMCGTLNTSEDFSDVVVDMGADALRQNILYREVMFTFAYHARRGIALDTVIDGLAAGRKTCLEQFGVWINFIADIDRSTSPEEAVDFVEQLIPYRNEAGIVAVGMDSQELGIPPSTHTSAFRIAAALGFHTTAHLGWEEGPEFIWEAIHELPLERIDHGLRAVEDLSLLAQLVESQTPVTSCPLSSIAVDPVKYPDLATHAFRKMWDAGVFLTLNSDDPAMIGTDLVTNYVEVSRAYSFDVRDITHLVKNGVRAAFMSDNQKEKLLDQIDRYSKIRRREF